MGLAAVQQSETTSQNTKRTDTLCIQRRRTQRELTLCADNVTEHKENSHFVHSGRDEGQDVVDGGTIKQVRNLAANTGLVA